MENITKENVNFIRESIHYIHHYLRKKLQKEAEKYGITLPQMRVINEVIKHQNIGVKKISDNLSMNHSTVSEVVERLFQKGILNKTPNPKDKRSVNISLTKDVSVFLEGNQTEIVNRSMIRVLNHLNPIEQERVREGLHLLMSAVEKEIESEAENKS